MAAPRFFVPSVSGEQTRVSLPPDEARHLARVLRLQPGAAVRVFDGHGAEWHGRVARVARGEAQVDILQRSTPSAEPPVRVTLAIGLLKGAQMDAVVRDATMLGVCRIVPLSTAHVAVPAASRDAPAVGARWQRIAVGSAKQCGRAVVPEISGVTPFDTVLETAASTSTVTIMSVEPSAMAGRPSAPWSTDPAPAEALALVGPEGGWAPAEIDAALQIGARLMGLGPRTLRAEAAPAVVLSSLWTRWGW